MRDLHIYAASPVMARGADGGDIRPALRALVAPRIGYVIGNGFMTREATLGSVRTGCGTHR